MHPLNSTYDENESISARNGTQPTRCRLRQQTAKPSKLRTPACKRSAPNRRSEWGFPCLQQYGQRFQGIIDWSPSGEHLPLSGAQPMQIATRTAAVTHTLTDTAIRRRLSSGFTAARSWCQETALQAEEAPETKRSRRGCAAEEPPSHAGTPPTTASTPATDEARGPILSPLHLPLISGLKRYCMWRRACLTPNISMNAVPVHPNAGQLRQKAVRFGKYKRKRTRYSRRAAKALQRTALLYPQAPRSRSVGKMRPCAAGEESRDTMPGDEVITGC